MTYIFTSQQGTNSQQKKGASGPMIWAFLVLPYAPPSWSSWLDQMVEQPLLDWVMASSRWQCWGRGSVLQEVIYDLNWHPVHGAVSPITRSPASGIQGEDGNPPPTVKPPFLLAKGLLLILLLKVLLSRGLNSKGKNAFLGGPRKVLLDWKSIVSLGLERICEILNIWSYLDAKLSSISPTSS